MSEYVYHGSALDLDQQEPCIGFPIGFWVHFTNFSHKDLLQVHFN